MSVRPDSPLSERRAALRNRKLEAQLEAQGARSSVVRQWWESVRDGERQGPPLSLKEVLEEPESPKCRKCVTSSEGG